MMTKGADGLAAHGAALTAAIVFGASTVAVRAIIHEIPPFSLAVLRAGQATLVLLIVMLIVSPGQLKVAWRDLPYLALLGAVMYSLFPLAYNTSLYFAEASRASIMLFTVPFWSALMARAGGVERLSKRQVMGILITFAGIGFVLMEQGVHWDGDISSIIGCALMLLAAFCMALYGVLVKGILSRYSPLMVVTYAMGLGTLFLLPLAMAEGLASITPQLHGMTLWLMLLLGIIGGGVAQLLRTVSLAGLAPTQVAVYLNLIPLIAALLGMILLAEAPTLGFALGLFVVMGGVLAVNWPAHQNWRIPKRPYAGAARALCGLSPAFFQLANLSRTLMLAASRSSWNPQEKE